MFYRFIRFTTIFMVTLSSQASELKVSSPMAVLKMEKLDKRVALPLKPMMALHQKENMRQHLEAVQEIITSLSRGDFEGVKSAVKPIGYTVKMARMCQHMGAGAPGFTERAINFHKTADQIALAAESKDSKAILSALSATLQTCTGCHSTYRQQIIDGN